MATGLIAAHRRSLPVRALHSVTSFVEAAYANEGAQFSRNGERTVIRRLRQASFQVAFDVGANFGDWTLEAQSAWPTCIVHAFEVAPLTFEQLRGRLANLSAPDRLVLNCCGLSDRSDSQQMFYYPEHPDLTCDLPRFQEYKTIPFEARLQTGDRYCQEHGIDTVDFLKIDVEGAEHRVLKGFTEHIAAQKIHCIQFEYGAFSTQTKVLLGDYYSLLSSSYWMGKIYPTYVDFREFVWTMEDFHFCNYCCVSKRRTDLFDLLRA